MAKTRSKRARQQAVGQVAGGGVEHPDQPVLVQAEVGGEADVVPDLEAALGRNERGQVVQGMEVEVVNEFMEEERRENADAGGDVVKGPVGMEQDEEGNDVAPAEEVSGDGNELAGANLAALGRNESQVVEGEEMEEGQVEEGLGKDLEDGELAEEEEEDKEPALGRNENCGDE